MTSLPRTRQPSHRPIGILLAAAVGLALAGGTAGGADLKKQLRFATEMARSGNWREAVFRWEKALEREPANARLLNNLAVAWETLGEFEKAEEAYRKALKQDPENREIRENFALFESFYKRLRRHREQLEATGGAASDGAEGEAAPPPAPEADGETGGKP